MSALFTLFCLQGQPETCQCIKASGVSVCTGVVLGVCDTEINPNDCSGGKCDVHTAARLRSSSKLPLLHKNCFLLRIPLHLENLSH